MPAVMGSGAERPFGRPADLGPVDADCVRVCGTLLAPGRAGLIWFDWV